MIDISFQNFAQLIRQAESFKDVYQLTLDEKTYKSMHEGKDIFKEKLFHLKSLEYSQQDL